MSELLEEGPPRTINFIRDFIYAINDSYNHLERDRILLERSMDISFNKLKESNQKLIESESMFFDMALNVPGMRYQFLLRPDGWMAFPYVGSGSMDLLSLLPEEMMQHAPLKWFLKKIVNPFMHH